MACCVCQRPNVTTFKTLALTEQEKEVVAASTKKPAPDQLDYCKACWGVTTNKVQGAQLFKGMVQLHLEASGVRDPEKVASALMDQMLKKAKRVS